MSEAYKFADYVSIGHRLLDNISTAAVEGACSLLEGIYRREGTVYVCGNGGSAANASHFAEDLAKLMWEPHSGRRLKVATLCGSTPFITALANDEGYARIFEIQLAVAANRGDALICISGSGNSPSIVHAARWAQQAQLQIVGLTGYRGGELAAMCHAHIHAPSENMGLLECVHMMILDYISKELRHRVYGVPHACR